MTEEDFAYLRNINTRPGPNAGRSIDPAKPGPTADRIAELEREITDLELDNKWLFSRDYVDQHLVDANNAAIVARRAELSRLRSEQPKEGDVGPLYDSRNPNPVRAIQPAPSPEPQDVREALRLARPYVAHHDDIKSFSTHTSEVLAKIDAALAQSDAQPGIDLDDARRAAPPSSGNE